MPPPFLRFLFFTRVCSWVCLAVPPQLSMLWDELNDHPQDVYDNQRKAKREASKRSGKGAKVTGTHEKPSSPLNHHTVLEEVPEKAAWRDGAVDSHQYNNNVPSRPGSTNPESPRAKSNWLRVGKAASQYRNRIDVPMIDISAPHSPISPNMMRSRHGSIWENAVTVMGVTTPRIQSREASVKGLPGVAGVSSDVLNMKQKRQCSLEWEFLATILDRIFLVIFTMTVVIVTVGIIVTGRVAQLAYDDIEEELSSSN
ncbi:CRE-DEG-3 protein [Aphelenchoides avenae]|nr:CRE-DEG-3 protein [Aphelenchus avenae]